MPKVAFENEEYAARDLSADEENKLQNALGNWIASPGSFLEFLIKRNYDSIRGALGVAKDRWDAPFKGISAGDSEIGIQKTRPGHILRTTATTEAAANTWSFTFTSAGDYYVGRDTNNTTAVNIDKEACLLILGVMFTQGAAPVVEELRIGVGGTTYPVVVIRDAWTADNDFGVRGIPIRPILLVPKATSLWETYSIAGGVNELVLVGLTYGYGRYLRNASYGSISL